MLNKLSLSLQLPDISHLTKSAAIHHIVCILIMQIIKSWDFPGVPVVEISPPGAGMQVRSLAGDTDPACLKAREPERKTEAIL